MDLDLTLREDAPFVPKKSSESSYKI